MKRSDIITAPFKPFFVLAALDAIIVGIGWFASLNGWAPARLAGEILGWHARELLFGFLTAVMSGFFLTALPRWTGRPVARWSAPLLFALWMAARFVQVLPPSFVLLTALPGLALTLIVALHVVQARDGRNVKTVGLLAVFCVSGLIAVAPVSGATQRLAVHFAVAAMAGLIMLIGGRVLPALSTRFDVICEVPARPQKNSLSDSLAAMTAAIGLILWLTEATGWFAAAIFLGVATTQIWRMSPWTGRRLANSPALIALFTAYSFLPIGFLFFAAQAAFPEFVPRTAGLHCWTVGCFGGMVLTVMSSVIRKRSHFAFVASMAGSNSSTTWRRRGRLPGRSRVRTGAGDLAFLGRAVLDRGVRIFSL